MAGGIELSLYKLLTSVNVIFYQLDVTQVNPGILSDWLLEQCLIQRNTVQESNPRSYSNLVSLGECLKGLRGFPSTALLKCPFLFCLLVFSPILETWWMLGRSPYWMVLPLHQIFPWHDVAFPLCTVFYLCLCPSAAIFFSPLDSPLPFVPGDGLKMYSKSLREVIGDLGMGLVLSGRCQRFS